MSILSFFESKILEIDKLKSSLSRSKEELKTALEHGFNIDLMQAAKEIYKTDTEIKTYVSTLAEMLGVLVDDGIINKIEHDSIYNKLTR